MNLMEPPLYDRARQLVEQYGLKAVVETGLGDSPSGLAFATDIGLHAYGCDIVFERCENAKANYPGFGVYNLTSTQFLSMIVPRLEVPRLFWLDAHGDDWPLYDELVILRDAPHGSVILCDDAHFVIDGDPLIGDKTLDDYLTVLPTHTCSVWGEKSDEHQPILEYLPK